MAPGEYVRAGPSAPDFLKKQNKKEMPLTYGIRMLPDRTLSGYLHSRFEEDALPAAGASRSFLFCFSRNV